MEGNNENRKVKSFQNGRVYKIWNTIDGEIYVGSTTQPLSKRMWRHKNDSMKAIPPQRIHKHMKDLGADNFSIELIEEFPCNNVEQLHKKEGEWVRKIATLNDRIPGRTFQEYMDENKTKKSDYDRQYYQDNKDKLLNYQQTYAAENKEKIRESKRNYYENNKEKFLERQLCICGESTTKQHKLRHERGQIHQRFLAKQPCQ